MRNLDNKTILLVSGYRALRASIAERLQAAGYFSTWSGDDVEAFAHAESAEPEPTVIVIDAGQPLDGVELRSARRWVPSIVNVPIAIPIDTEEDAAPYEPLVPPRDTFDLLRLLKTLEPGKRAASGPVVIFDDPTRRVS
jgi:hypothetical protein